MISLTTSYILQRLPWLDSVCEILENCTEFELSRISLSHINVGSISQPVPQHVSNNFSLIGHSCNPWSEQVFCASSNVASRLQGFGDIQVEPLSSQHLTACLSLSLLDAIFSSFWSPGNFFRHPFATNW